MEHIPDDELISAYLDGELTGQELARAEQLLAAQPESRQMLDELTALRATLQSLPRQKLGADFADSVLRRAEREMLQAGASDGVAPMPVATWKPEVPPILSMSRWTRPIIWSALATAAAIMVMLFAPPEAEKQVAMAPAPNADGPIPAMQRLEVRALPDDDGNVDDAHRMIAKSGPTQNGFLAGAAAEDRSPAADQEAELRSLAADGDADTLLVVRCDVTPEVARSASFRRMLAEHQIPWQEATDHDRAYRARGGVVGPLRAQTGAQGQSFGAPGKEKMSDKAPGGDEPNPAADAAPLAPTAERPLAARAESAPAADALAADHNAPAGPQSTEAVYVIATPSQVDATIAAIAGSGEYRNLQMTELAGPLPAELSVGLEEVSRADANANGSVDQGVAADGVHRDMRENAIRKNKAQDKAEDEADRGDASPDHPSAAPAARPGAAEGAGPGNADVSTDAASSKQSLAPPGDAREPGERQQNLPRSSMQRQRPVAIMNSAAAARPVAAHASPAPLSSETLAELSRALGDTVADADVAVSNAAASDAAESNATESNTAGEDAKRGGGKRHVEQHERPFDASDDAKSLNEKASSGLSQSQSAKPSSRSMEIGKQALEQTGDRANSPNEPAAPAGQSPTRGVASPAVAPAPVAKPAMAPPPTNAAPATDSAAPSHEASRGAGGGQQPPAGATNKQPQAIDKDSHSGKKEGGGRGAAPMDSDDAPPPDPTSQPDEASDLEAAQAQAGVLRRRAIFLFRVVPEPAASPER